MKSVTHILHTSSENKGLMPSEDVILAKRLQLVVIVVKFEWQGKNCPTKFSNDFFLINCVIWVEFEDRESLPFHYSLLQFSINRFFMFFLKLKYVGLIAIMEIEHNKNCDVIQGNQWSYLLHWNRLQIPCSALMVFWKQWIWKQIWKIVNHAGKMWSALSN